MALPNKQQFTFLWLDICLNMKNKNPKKITPFVGLLKSDFFVRILFNIFNTLNNIMKIISWNVAGFRAMLKKENFKNMINPKLNIP